MKITFLGTGTSHGIPVIACDCDVCRSSNPKNARLRSSVMIETAGKNILIDTPPDFRQQMLKFQVERIDAILFTHHHADHIFGLDDVRRFNEIQCEAIHCYAGKNSMPVLRTIFDYAFHPPQEGGGVPKIVFKESGTGEIKVCGQRVEVIEIFHGKLKINGYRIGDFAYITDCSRIPAESMKKLKGVKVLILGVLRHEKHSTHFSVSEAVEVSNILKPGKTFFTHMCHRLEHEKTNAELPENIQLAYDGMTIKIKN